MCSICKIAGSEAQCGRLREIVNVELDGKSDQFGIRQGMEWAYLCARCMHSQQLERARKCYKIKFSRGTQVALIKGECAHPCAQFERKCQKKENDKSGRLEIRPNLRHYRSIRVSLSASRIRLHPRTSKTITALPHNNKKYSTKK